MADAAKRLFEVDAIRLKELLNESNKRLQPLADPLSIDFGTHRWLSEDREEAYSDWLAWIIEQIDDPLAALRIFGITEVNNIAELKDTAMIVEREFPVPCGHEGREGRLDLVIRIGGHAVVVVEVKKTDADIADTEKQKGYCAWLQAQPEPLKKAILLASDGSEESYDQFRLITWADVCVELRRLTARFCAKNKLLLAAMILSFIGAVEQNLLGFSCSTINCIVNRQVVTFDLAIVEHLDRSLTAEGEHQ